MEVAPEPTGRAPGVGALAFTALTGAVVAGSVFAGGGSRFDRVLPVGGAAVLLLAATLVALSFGSFPRPALGFGGALLVGVTVLLVAWIGITVVWSIEPDRSWDAFDKSLAYLAFLGLGVALGRIGGGRAARLTATLLSLVLGAALVFALVAKAIPSLDPEGDRIARLREPVDYWNALALLADVAVVLGLWLGTTREHRRATRVVGGLLVYVATLALMLTLSRAGVVVGIVVVALWLGLRRERVASWLLLLASAAPAALIGAWAFTRPALTDDLAGRADRVSDGRIFGIATLGGAVVVAVLVALGARRSLTDAPRRRLGRSLAIAAATALLVSGAVVSVAAADAVRSGTDCSEVVNDPSRFRSLDPNNRLCWWGEAWDVFRRHSPEGAGAGTFEVARKRFRSDARNVVQPHSVPLQLLADGGVVGLGLFVALVLAGAGVCVGSVRRLSGGERTAALALVAVPTAYAVHALVDYNWDFLAVTAPTMVTLGALATAGRTSGSRRRPTRRPLLAVGVLLVAAAALVSFAFPRLADSAARNSTRALAAGDLDRARDEARRAAFFNPVSADALFARGRAAEGRGDTREAEEFYIDAVELQPENPETWYTLGIFEFQVRDNHCAAYRFLNEAYTLDGAGSEWTPGGPLDVSRAAVNRGACAAGS